MEQQNLFKGRDKRRKGWFWMDNDYLNGWAKYFGAVGTAIYVSLCRHADNESQKCFPAQELIAEELSISVSTVKRYISLFRKHYLISVQRERNPRTKKWLNNVYTLLDKEHWQKPQLTDTPGKPQLTKDKARAHSELYSFNKTHMNKTHLETPSVSGKEINDLIELFKDLNPSYKLLFKNKNQRAAIERMVKEYGLEQLTKMIKALPGIVKMPYAPRVSTPIQLETKMGEIKQFVQQLKSKGESKKIIFI